MRYFLSTACAEIHTLPSEERKKMLKQQKQPGGSVDRNLRQKIDKATASHLPDAYSWHLSMSPHMTLSLSTACEVLPHL